VVFEVLHESSLPRRSRGKNRPGSGSGSRSPDISQNSNAAVTGISRVLSKHLFVFCPPESRWHDAQWQLPLSDFENIRDIL
jgi:hypothetical protein